MIYVPQEWDEDQIRFYVEENGCPGTGQMGLEIDRLIKEGDVKRTCWACTSNGKCKVLDFGDGSAV